MDSHTAVLRKDFILEEKYNLNILLYFSFIFLKILDNLDTFSIYILLFSLDKCLGF